MAIPSFFPPQQTPSESLIYGFSWGDWIARNAIDNPALETDTIDSATVSATPAGLSIGPVAIDMVASVVRVMISGGQDQTDYLVTCLVTMTSGMVASSQQLLQVRASAYGTMGTLAPINSP